MAASLNQVTLVGNLTKSPEIRFVPSGQAVCNLRMALNRKYKAGDGTWKEEVTYVGVEVWGKTAEACGEYLQKGSAALIEGRLVLKEWEKEGVKRSQLEVCAERVQFLSGKKAEGATEGGADASNIPF